MKPVELKYNYRNHVGLLVCDELPNESDRPVLLADFVKLDAGVHKVKFSTLAGVEKEAWMHNAGQWSRIPTRADNLRSNKLAGKSPGRKGAK